MLQSDPHYYVRPGLWLATILVLLTPVDQMKAGELTEAKATVPPPLEKKETKDKNWLSLFDGKVVFDIEERIRGEIRENNRDFDSAVHDDNDDSWLLNRFRLGLAVKPVLWLKVYGQMQDSREAFSDRANIPGVRGGEGDDEADLRQGYIQLGDLKKSDFQLTVGRQAISYGDSRLVADSQWGNFGRTFDAVRLRWEHKYFFWVELFAMRPVQIQRHEFNDSDSADNFFGAYFSTDFGNKQALDFYYFYRDKDDNQPNLDPTNRTDPEGTWNGPAARFSTIGARVKNASDTLNGWDYTAEIAYQFGDIWRTEKASPRSDLSAFAAHVSGGYTWKDAKWKPRLGLEYDFASGDDDPTDTDFHSFQNLFPSNHNKYGFMDEFSWRNIHDLRFQANIKPIKKLDLEFDYHAFWLANTHDFWYRSNGISTLRTRTPDGRDVRTIGADPFAGHEIDLTGTYEVTHWLKFQTGYSHFFAGQYLADTGSSDDADFAYFMTTFNF
jgi:hypothetical protein